MAEDSVTGHKNETLSLETEKSSDPATAASSEMVTAPLKKSQESACLSPYSRYLGLPHLPPTPDTTPTKPGGKRAAQYAFEDRTLELPSVKRRLTEPTTTITKRSLIRQDSIPKFSILHRRLQPEPMQLSADEFKRTCEAVLKQVDWDEVQGFVASNRRGNAYRNAIKSTLQAQLYKLFRGEELSGP